MLNQKLSQKQLQRLSPQQIQLMKLIQIPTARLEERIKEELEANPALEEGPEQDNAYQEFPEINDMPANEAGNDETAEETEAIPEVNENTAWEEELEDLSAYYSDDDTADYKIKDDHYADPDEEERVIPVAVQTTFLEYLENQLQELDLTEKEQKIAEQIIGSIDEDGYLRRETDAIVDDLSFQQNISATQEEVEAVLEKIQQLDPPGIAARNLKECLLLQLNKMKPSEPGVPVAFRIIDEQFEAFTKKHYEKIQRELQLTDQQLKQAMDVILKLNPKPGSSYSGSIEKEIFIIPDFIVVNNNGKLELSLNSRNAPELRISNEFKDMLRDYDKTKNKTKEQKEAILFIKQKIDSAKWFIDAIKQRQMTLLHTMQAIMNYQHDFFLTGDETKLKKMILKDIADITGQDISTVSRVSNSKYVQTEFGTFPLKFFFSEGITTDTGEEVSSREVKRILQDLINAEDKSKPLSDQHLMEELNKRGYNIARRTVAKYREMLDIPIARLRKEL
jgi:RNA polymerase sigma-54 factor